MRLQHELKSHIKREMILCKRMSGRKTKQKQKHANKNKKQT